MSDVPPGVDPVDPSSSQILLNIQDILSEISESMKSLSEYQRETLKETRGFNKAYTESTKDKGNESKTSEDTKKKTLSFYDEQITTQKTIIKSFQEVIDEQKNSAEWFKKNFSSINDEMRGFKRTSEKEVTRETAKYVDKNFMSGVLNELARNIPAFGIMTGRTPKVYDTQYRKGKEDIVNSHANRLKELEADIVARRTLSPEDYDKFNSAKKSKKGFEDVRRKARDSTVYGEDTSQNSRNKNTTETAPTPKGPEGIVISKVAEKRESTPKDSPNPSQASIGDYLTKMYGGEQRTPTNKIPKASDKEPTPSYDVNPATPTPVAQPRDPQGRFMSKKAEEVSPVRSQVAPINQISKVSEKKRPIYSELTPISPSPSIQPRDPQGRFMSKKAEEVSPVRSQVAPINQISKVSEKKHPIYSELTSTVPPPAIQPRGPDGRFISKKAEGDSETAVGNGPTRGDPSEGDMLRLPFKYGGPALFLAGEMERIFGEQKEPRAKVEGNGIFGDMLSALATEGIGGLLGVLFGGGKGGKPGALPKFNFATFIKGVGPSVLGALIKIPGWGWAVAAGLGLTWGLFALNDMRVDGLKEEFNKNLKPEDLKKLEKSGVDMSKSSEWGDMDLLQAKKILSGDFSGSKRGKLDESKKGTTEYALQKLINEDWQAKNKDSPFAGDGSYKGGYAWTMGPNGTYTYEGKGKKGTMQLEPTDKEALKGYGSSTRKDWGKKYDARGTEIPNTFDMELSSKSKLQLHSGGVVPGPSSMEVPSVLLGGERVLSHNQNKNMESLLQQMVDQQKQLIDEMKNNTKATIDKELVIPSPPPQLLNSSVGSY